MNKFSEILKQPEGRRLEFKVALPANADLSKTIVAFANDAGGVLYIGVKDNPREIIGLDKNDIIKLEEKISNIIHDQCAPLIRPENTFITHEGKHIIKTQIYKGSNPPYHIKSMGIKKGTFIRVGSTNRLAEDEIIAELERQKQNISFDSEIFYKKAVTRLNMNTFKALFFEKTGEKLTTAVMKKLDLFREVRGENMPTLALILLSDNDLRKKIFPYSKIECARFKGTVP